MTGEGLDREDLVAALASLAEAEQQGARAEAAEAFAGLSLPTLRGIHASIPRLAPVLRQPAAFFADLVATHDWDTEADILRTLPFADLAQPGASSSELLAFSKGLDHYADLFGGKDPGALEGRDLAVARALVRIGLVLLYDVGWSKSPLNDWLSEPLSRYIADPELVAVVAEHAERAEEIVEFVTSRQSAEAALLRDYLSEPRPFSNGVL